MTEPIDQATKDLIEKEAEDLPIGTGSLASHYRKGYVGGATVWAEKLKRERELRKELVDGFLKLFQMELHIPSEHWVEWSEYHKQIESLIQKAKDKSHE